MALYILVKQYLDRKRLLPPYQTKGNCKLSLVQSSSEAKTVSSEQRKMSASESEGQVSASGSLVQASGKM